MPLAPHHAARFSKRGLIYTASIPEFRGLVDGEALHSPQICSKGDIDYGVGLLTRSRMAKEDGGW